MDVDYLTVTKHMSTIQLLRTLIDLSTEFTPPLVPLACYFTCEAAGLCLLVDHVVAQFAYSTGADSAAESDCL